MEQTGFEPVFFERQPQLCFQLHYCPIFKLFGGLLNYTLKPAELQIETIVLIC